MTKRLTRASALCVRLPATLVEKARRLSAHRYTQVLRSPKNGGVQASARRAWERTGRRFACSRKLYSGRHISCGCHGPFADKSAPTAFGQNQKRTLYINGGVQASARRAWERTGRRFACSRKLYFGRHISCGCHGPFADKSAATDFGQNQKRTLYITRRAEGGGHRSAQ